MTDQQSSVSQACDLRPELAAIIGGDRFLAEIRTTANLQHPHILPWLADNTVLFSTEVPTDVMRLRADASAPAVPVLNADWTERAPRISPDGSWIAYISEEDGTPRVNIRRWPALTGKVTTSGGVAAGSYPIWSRDSRTLYVQEESQLVAAHDHRIELARGAANAAGQRQSGVALTPRGGILSAP